MEAQDIQGHCLCVCQCVGCTAIRESSKTCQCPTCQFLRFMPANQTADEHQCFKSCQCQACEALMRHTRECDCLVCIIFAPQPQ